MTSSFSLNPVAVEAAAKAVAAYELECDPDVCGEVAEAAIRAFFTAEGASYLRHGKAERIVTEWREL